MTNQIGPNVRLEKFRENHLHHDQQVYLEIAKNTDVTTRLDEVAEAARREDLAEVHRVVLFIEEPGLDEGEDLIAIGYGPQKAWFNQLFLFIDASYSENGLVVCETHTESEYHDGGMDPEDYFNRFDPIVTGSYKDTLIWERFSKSVHSSLG